MFKFKISLLLILIISIPLHAKSFNPKGKVFCQTYMGDYDYIGKMHLQVLKSNGKRDLFVTSSNYRGSDGLNGKVFKNACKQTRSKIQCSFQPSSQTYTLQFNIKKIYLDYDNGEIYSAEINDDTAYVTSSGWFSTEKRIHCQQYAEDMKK